MISSIQTNLRLDTAHKSMAAAFLAVFILFIGVQTMAAGTAASRRPADEPLSRFLRFGRLTVADGLSNDQIWGVAQDRHGFIWVAANDGLNRYDGSDVKVYRHNPDDPRSLGHSFIRTMIADQNGTIWAGTWGAV